MEGPQAKEYRQPQQAKNGSNLTTSKETEISILQSQGIILCQNLSEFGSGVLPKSRAQPGWNLDFRHMTSWAWHSTKPAWAPDLQNCNIINGCCFKLCIRDNLLHNNRKLMQQGSCNSGWSDYKLLLASELKLHSLTSLSAIKLTFSSPYDSYIYFSISSELQRRKKRVFFYPPRKNPNSHAFY